MTQVYRNEISPCAWLTCIDAPADARGFLSIHLITQLEAENASKNAIIPRILCRGTQLIGEDALPGVLSELSASISPSVKKLGELQCVGLYGEFDQAGGSDRRFSDLARLMCDMLLSPSTRGGLFLPAMVEEEKSDLKELLCAGLSVREKLLKLMCFSEDYSLSVYGTEEEAESIGYQRLTKYYRSLLGSCPIEIIYCGALPADTVFSVLSDALISLPRGDINVDIGTDIRMNSLEEQPCEFEDTSDRSQSSACVGFRLGECMEDPDPGAILVLAQLLDGDICGVDICKGILTVECADAETVISKLETIKGGRADKQEFTDAKNAVAAKLSSIPSRPIEYADFALINILSGLDCAPDELAELAAEVTEQDLIDTAVSLECDAILRLVPDVACDE